MLSWSEINAFLVRHNVDYIKDIVVPNFGIDKILAIVAIVYAVRTFSVNNKIAKANFRLQLIQSHRDIWSKIQQSNLSRIRDPLADATSVTEEEQRHVIYLIQHASSLFLASKNGLYNFDSSSKLDFGTFFNKPIPSHVWRKVKKFYPKKFVRFLDKIIVTYNGKKPKPLHKKILQVSSIKFYRIFQRAKNFIHTSYIYRRLFR